MTTKKTSARAAALALAPALALLLAGCGGADSALFGGSGASGGGASATTGSGGGSTGSSEGGGGSAGGGSPGGPVIRIHLRASTAPFEHDDEYSGQTPIEHSGGMLSFQLFEEKDSDPPMTVFDYGSKPVEVGYGDGDDTVVATVDPKTLTPGKYKLGRVVHSHVRYRVKATVHYGALDVPGEFDNFQVMTDGSVIDGETYDAGHYEYIFHAGGKDFPQTGENAPVPEYKGSGGFGVKVEAGEWAYWFPVNLVLSKDIPSDVDIVMDVNMHESFRWEDKDEDGYEEDVFDVSPPKFEPVKRFGANSFSVYLD